MGISGKIDSAYTQRPNAAPKPAVAFPFTPEKADSTDRAARADLENKIKKIERELGDYFFIIPKVFIDQKPNKIIELAGCYRQLGDYEKAIEIVKSIIETKPTTNARADKYDEAVFSMVDTYRMQFIALTSICKNAEAEAALDSALDLLRSGIKKLRGMEDGYKSNYSATMLNIYSMRVQSLAAANPAKIDAIKKDMFAEADKLLYSATDGNNFYRSPFGGQPKYSDNFIALNAIISYANLHQAFKDFDAAIEKYDEALRLIDKIENTPSIFNSRNIETDPKYLYIYRQRVYLGKAAALVLKMPSAGQADQTAMYADAAVNLFLARWKAAQIAANLEDDYYSERKWEERALYFNTVLEFSDLLININKKGINSDVSKAILQMKGGPETAAQYKSACNYVRNAEFFAAKLLNDIVEFPDINDLSLGKAKARAYSLLAKISIRE